MLSQPAGHEARQRSGRHFRHGDDAHRKRSDRQNAELDHLGDHHADHAALDHVNRGDGDQDHCVLIGRKMPGQECRRKLPDAFESIGEEADDADERVDHNDQVRKLRAASGAETRLDPLRAGHHVRSPEPCRQINHQEDLVESRPQPRDPDALQSVDEHPVHQQHGSADIEHAGRIRDAEHVPRHGVAAEEVGLHVARGAVGNPVSDKYGRTQVGDDDGNIDGM